MKTFKVTVTSDDGQKWGTTFNVTDEAAKGKTDKLMALLAIDSLASKMEAEVVEDAKDSSL